MLEKYKHSMLKGDQIKLMVKKRLEEGW